MARPRTIFLTYLFETDQLFAEQEGFGYSNAIHCNYIQKIETEDINNKHINFAFPNSQLFPFMRPASGLTFANGDGSGWSGKRIKVLAQIINGVENGDTLGTTDFTPDSNNWVVIDITNQLVDYATFSATTIPSNAFIDTVFQINEVEIQTGTTYNLNYLNYPTNQVSQNSKLGFGEEAFFYGNVKTDIQAVTYTTDIAITLPLNNFNTTTNPTHDGSVPVQISEVGIYDDEGNLVAIGKLNNPISKDPTRDRTILFNLDF